MPKHTDYSRISGFAIQNVLCLESLELFRKRLEKEYYANVLIRKFECEENQSNLVVEFQSNLTLVELLYHVQKRNVGQLTRLTNNDLIDNAFAAALSELREANGCEIDIEELTFFLVDSEITLKRIYKNSIEDQLGNIYRELSKHLSYISDNQSRIPSEIFIPVFEENLEEKFKKGKSEEQASSSTRDYFNFWGIYFSHNDDAVIYDLGMRSIISGDLYMLD